MKARGREEQLEEEKLCERHTCRDSWAWNMKKNMKHVEAETSSRYPVVTATERVFCLHDFLASYTPPSLPIHCSLTIHLTMDAQVEAQIETIANTLRTLPIQEATNLMASVFAAFFSNKNITSQEKIDMVHVLIARLENRMIDSIQDIIRSVKSKSSRPSANADSTERWDS